MGHITPWGFDPKVGNTCLVSLKGHLIHQSSFDKFSAACFRHLWALFMMSWDVQKLMLQAKVMLLSGSDVHLEKPNYSAKWPLILMIAHSIAPSPLNNVVWSVLFYFLLVFSEQWTLNSEQWTLSKQLVSKNAWKKYRFSPISHDL